MICLLAFSLLAGQDITIKKIRVVSDNNYPPYVFFDSNGNIQGIVYDEWMLWEKITGIEVEFEACDWDLAIKKFERGDADVLETVFYSKTRAQTMLFSKPYAEIRVPVFFAKDLTGIKELSDLQGFTIGAKSGDNVIRILRENGVDYIIEFNSYEEIIKAARDRKINIFTIDEPPAIYFLTKYKLLNRFKYGFNLYTGHFHRAVKKNNKHLLSIIEKGYSQIPEKQHNQIMNKWMGKSIAYWDYNSYLPFIIIGILITLTVILILFFVNMLLKVKINKKTKELQNALEVLKESEKMNKMLINALPDMVFILSEEGIFLDYKSASSEKLLFEPEFFIGKQIFDILPRYLAELTLEKIDQVKKSGKIQSYEYSLTIDNVEEFYDTRLSKYSSNSYLAIIRNISYLKRIEQERNRANKLESLGILAGGIAHDFNNILTAIIGSVSLLKMKLRHEPEYYKVLDETEKAGNRAKVLTSKLLTFAKGGMPLKETGSINQIIKESAEFTLTGSNCTCSFSLMENLPEISFDKSLISQTIQNLVLNAIQSMPAGGKISIAS